jgi:hypothetical protein
MKNYMSLQRALTLLQGFKKLVRPVMVTHSTFPRASASNGQVTIYSGSPPSLYSADCAAGGGGELKGSRQEDYFCLQVYCRRGQGYGQGHPPLKQRLCPQLCSPDGDYCHF